MTKQGLLHFSLLLCFLFSNSGVIKGSSPGFWFSGINDPISASFIDSSASKSFSPIIGKVISPFGYRGHHNHEGTDIKLHKGDTVRAAFSGQVTKASRYSGYGNLVILKHVRNAETYYAHLSKCLVKVGDSVMAGDVVGLGGRTGRATTDHLHFEVRVNKVPKNPEKFFSFNSNTAKPPVVEYPREIFIKNEKEVANNVSSNDFVIIQKGDTLYAIAKRYGTTVKQLQEINQLQSSNLKIGMNLKVK